MTVIGICRRPRARAGWVRGPSTKPSSTRSAYLVPSAEFATPGLGVLVLERIETPNVTKQNKPSANPYFSKPVLFKGRVG